MDSRLLQQIIRSLQAKVRCPVCGAKYPETGIEFRGQHRNFYLFRLTCPQCHSHVFASVMTSGSKLHPRADIFLEPAPKEAPLPPIKADEVIEFARFLDKTKSKLSSWLR